MSTPIETNRNPWVLPGFILWGFAPAIIMCLSILDGWYTERYTSNLPGRSPATDSTVGEAIFMVGVLGMPITLYPWCIIAIKRFAAKRFVVAALVAIPLTPVMCAVNLVLGRAGCTGLTTIIPKEGLF